MTTDQNTSKMQFSKVFNLDKIPLASCRALAVSSRCSVNCSKTILIFSYPQLSAFEASEWVAHQVSLRRLTMDRPPRTLTKISHRWVHALKKQQTFSTNSRTLKQQKCCPLQSGRPGLGNVQSKDCSQQEDSLSKFLLVIPSIYHSYLIYYHMIGLYSHLLWCFSKKCKLFSSSAALWLFISINCTNLQ